MFDSKRALSVAYPLIGLTLSLAIIVSLLIPTVVRADGNLTLDTAAFGCQSASITYTLAADESGIVGIRVLRADESELGSASGGNTAGTHTVSIQYSETLPSGTIVFAVANSPNGSAATGLNACVSEAPPVPSNTSTPTNTPVPVVPTNTPTPTDTAVPAQEDVPAVIPPDNPPPTTWPGQNDGRIDPDRGEPYTVYCTDTTLNVWSSVDPGAPVAVFELSAIANVVSPQRSIVNGVIFWRSGNVASVSGTNNNYAPEFRVKSFDWAACYKNRVAPTATSTPTLRSVKEVEIVPTATPTSTPTPNTAPDTDDQNGISEGFREYLDLIALICFGPAALAPLALTARLNKSGRRYL